MKHNFTPAVKTTRVHAPVAAGSTDVTDCVVIDMQGYQGVRFLVGFGTLSASSVTGISAKHSDAVSSGTALDDGEAIEGSLVEMVQDSDSSTLASLEINGPTKRYVQLVIERADANAVVEFAIAEQYRAGFEPVAESASVSRSGIVFDPVDAPA